MDDQSTDRECARLLAWDAGRLVSFGMKFFGDNPLGRWPHRFTFVEDLGCGFTFLGFVLFVVVVLIVKEVLF